MFGQIVHIWYEVHVFVKYDAWNDFGSGNFVSFPIIIVPKQHESENKSADIFMHSNWGPG